jgi:hypothetical protein
VPDLEGFKTLSSKMSYHMNLVLFPEKLLKGSSVEFYDAHGKLVLDLQGDKDPQDDGS